MKKLNQLVFYVLIGILFSSCFSRTEDAVYTVYHPVVQDKDIVNNSIGFKKASEALSNVALDNAGKVVAIPDENKLYVIDYYKGVFVSDLDNPSLDSIWVIPGIISFDISGDYLYANSGKNYFIFNRKTGEKVFEVKDFFDELTPPDYGSIPKFYNEGIRPPNTAIIGWTLDSVAIGDKLERFNIFDPFFVSDYFVVMGQTLYIVEKNYVSVFDISDPSDPQYVNYMGISNGYYILGLRPMGSNIALQTNSVTYIFDSQYNFVQSYIGLSNCMPFVLDQDKNLLVVLRHSGACSASNGIEFYDVSQIENPELDTSFYMNYPTDLALTDSDLVVCDGVVRFYDRDSLPLLYQVDSLNIDALYVDIKDSVFVFTRPNSIDVYIYTQRNNFDFKGSIPLVKTFVD